MTKMIETLIDQLLLHVPSTVFVDFPLLATLLTNPNGRYVVAALVVVCGFIALWLVLRLLQILLGSGANQTKPAKTKDGVSPQDQAGNDNASAQGKDEFQFFKRTATGRMVSDDDAALAAIEQEMLAIRQLFTDGHILKDVYVTETRRLYSKAKTLKA